MKSLIPKNARKIALRPLALGEVTGHHHSLCTLDPEVKLDKVAKMYEVANASGAFDTYLSVLEDNMVALTHQEHKPHLIPAGEYQVNIQQQITDYGAMPVVD
jgi:hypothetical protein